MKLILTDALLHFFVLVMRRWCGSLVLFFCLELGACEQEWASLTAAAYSCLPAQIYCFLAQCKDYQRELCGPALALSRFIDLLLFQIQNVHSSSKQGILGLWVPSMERRGSVLLQADRCGCGAPTCKRRGAHQDIRAAFTLISLPYRSLGFFLSFPAVKLMDCLSASQSSLYS